MASYTKALVAPVTKFLDDGDFNYTFDRKTGILVCVCALDCKLDRYSLVVTFGDGIYLVYHVLQIKASPNRYAEVIDFITRVNYAQTMCWFQMDVSDGEIRVATSVQCDKRIPSNEVVASSLSEGENLLEKYGNALLSVVNGYARPQDAYAAARDK